MFKKQLLILLFIFWAQHSSCLLLELFDVVQKGSRVVQIINDMKSTNDTEVDVVSFFNDADDYEEIVNELQEMNHKLDNLKAFTRNGHNYISSLIEQLPAKLAVERKKEKLSYFMLRADSLSKLFQSYIRNKSGGKMLVDLVNAIVEELYLPLIEFRHVLTPFAGTTSSQRDGLFWLIIENAHKQRDTLCGLGETPHHEILRLFHIALSTEVKVHILLSYAYRVKYDMDNGWKESLESGFKEQLRRIFDASSNSLKLTELPYIRSCDPEDWKIDENYYSLYGYHQETIYYVNKCGGRDYPGCEDLNKGIGSKTLKKGPWSCTLEPLNKHAQCDGEPFDCKSLNRKFDDTITCAWEKGPYRIRFAKSDSQTFGTDKESIAIMAENRTMICPPGNGYSQLHSEKAGSHEDSCRLGLQFHKVHDYIYIRIAEGKLEANGYISNYSWAPPTRTTRSSSDVTIERVKGNEIMFHLGDVQLLPGDVLTGILLDSHQFIGQHCRIILFIAGNKFDYDTGKLIGKARGLTVRQRGNRELTFPTKTPINKTKYENSTTPKSDGYSHLRLQPSDISDDFGQTTLPLLDGIPIMTEPLSPIGGVGLFYKGTLDYAGFLSFRLYPINFTHIMENYMESPEAKALLNLNE